jgi:hypothetical protein
MNRFLTEEPNGDEDLLDHDTYWSYLNFQSLHSKMRHGDKYSTPIKAFCLTSKQLGELKSEHQKMLLITFVLSIKKVMWPFILTLKSRLSILDFRTFYNVSIDCEPEITSKICKEQGISMDNQFYFRKALNMILIRN